MWWKLNAKHVEKVYGGFVDWDERFYNCPECCEPVYEDDWEDKDLSEYLCPVCEFEEPEDYLDDCDYEVGFDPYCGCFTDDC